MRGFTGKILNVNLDNGSIKEEIIEETVYKKVLSGLGLAAHILYERIPENADPLGPENILGFVSGMLTGTGTHFSGRWMAAAKSPLTGTWGDANAGGTFAPAIKRCGYDGIFFKGISPKPVYLQIDNKGARLVNAEHLWGKDSIETEEALTETITSGKAPSIAAIGQSGENLSLISGISNEKGRIAARSGLGAVMGSKKLKALVLCGSKPVKVWDKAKLDEVQNKHDELVKSAPAMPLPGWLFRMMGSMAAKAKSVSAGDGLMSYSVFEKWGTGCTNQMAIEMGDAPIKNWKGSNLDFKKKRSKSYNPDNIKKNEFQKYHCDSCPVGCGGHYRTKNQYKQTHKPEYETVNHFGALILNEDLESLVLMNELCNRSGLDTISVGGTIAFALECYENGVITKADTDGLELTWGNSKAIVALLKKMIAREGIGDILADGSRVAAKRLGKGSEKWSITAGGQELAAHDSRLDPGFGLHYSVEPTPGRHTNGAQMYYDQWRLWEQVPSLPDPGKSYPVEEKYEVTGKGIRGVACSIFKVLADSSGLCLFSLMPGVTRFPVHDFLNAVTGFDYTLDDYFVIGRRIQTIRQMFNIKQGIKPVSLIANERSYGSPPLEKGVLAGKQFDLLGMMKDYWKMMEWDPESGVPTPETISKLGLEA